MPVDKKILDYNTLSEENQEEVNQKIRELNDQGLEYKEIKLEIKAEMRVIIKQHHIAEVLKVISKKKPIHKEVEIQAIDEEIKDFSIKELQENLRRSTRQILLKAKDTPFRFNVVRLSVSKKYGTTKSEKIDESMELCHTAIYSFRENLVFPMSRTIEGQGKVTKAEEKKGITEKIIKKKTIMGLKRGTVRIDSDGDYVQKKDAIKMDLEGNPLEIFPPSLCKKDEDKEIELTDIIDIDKVLDHDVNAQYFLFPIEGQDDTKLQELMLELESSTPPKFLALKFNYTASTEPQDAYLQLIEENENRYILLSAGTVFETEYLGLEETPKSELEVEEESVEELLGEY